MIDSDPTDTPSSFAIISEPENVRVEGVNLIALVDKKKETTADLFWTGEDSDIIFRCFSQELANKICSRFKYNKPRAVDYWEAKRIIDDQAKFVGGGQNG